MTRIVSPGPIQKQQRTNQRWMPLVFTAMLFSVASQFAFANPNKLDSFAKSTIEAPRAGQSKSYIVAINGSLTAAHRKSLKSIRAKVVGHVRLIDTYVVVVPDKSLHALAALPFVKRVSSDVPVQKNDVVTLERTFAKEAFEDYGLTGEGVTVAVIDSGVSKHADLTDPDSGQSRIIGSMNFVPSSNSSDDANGHGTHVAGIVAGSGEMSSGPKSFKTYFGMARGAKIVNVRVLDSLGQTKVSTLLSALQWVVDNRQKYKIRVLNLSLGHAVGESYTTDPLCQAVEKAWKSGIVVVCAAGNEGRSRKLALGPDSDNDGYGTEYGSIGSPGNDPYVITVGSMRSEDANRQNDTASTFSSRGPSMLDFVLKPDIMAPGNKIISLRKPLSFLELTSLTNVVPAKEYVSGAGLLSASHYFRLSGTSMAAPVVAGAAALMLQKDPTLSPNTVKARLMLSADKWFDANGEADPCTYGSGYLNVVKALQSNVIATQSANSPFLVRNSLGDVMIKMDDSIWGERALWGTNISELRAVWGNRALWGKNTLGGNRALWGKSVWGNRAIWGKNVIDLGLLDILLSGD